MSKRGKKKIMSKRKVLYTDPHCTPSSDTVWPWVSKLFILSKPHLSQTGTNSTYFIGLLGK